MSHTIKITAIERATHDVHRYVLEKPDGYEFVPGQATDVSIDKPEWRDEKRPFTFTCLPGWDRLEFTIKHYPDHDGVTDALSDLEIGEALLIDDPWGAIEYKGPGTFIAGGAGVTPFIAILRSLEAQGKLAGHRLIFANKTEADIINRKEFEAMAGLELVYVLSDENKDGFAHGFVDKNLLQQHINDFSQEIYLCGPEPMQDAVKNALKELGADPESVTFEK
ncbi:FAD-binding oxidoreductase [Pararhizobium sp. IMCC21322]|uniref:FAD-binding oxidoreductase n=1 Tax=Pararhizobium sp. IMCC21322 TaxID=3067903 RepID=UPI002740AA85|nr:FAD-binding oxidoreductase [Pararhizobium sp. IMCC21322]